MRQASCVVVRSVTASRLRTTGSTSKRRPPMDGDAALTNMIETMRALHTIAERAAKLAAPRVEEAIRTQVGRGLDPEGRPWPPTKDGKRPLANAANAIHSEARGDVVVIVLRGPEVFH